MTAPKPWGDYDSRWDTLDNGRNRRLFRVSSVSFFSHFVVAFAAPADLAVLAAVDSAFFPHVGVAWLLVVIAVAVWTRIVYVRRTRELRESEERFRALFDNAIEGVYETPPEGGFRRVNPAMARILGFSSPAEVLRITPAKTACLYASPTRRDQFFAALGASDELANFESEIRRPDGTTGWIKENVHAVRDGSGRLLYLQGFVTDITARKQAEDALSASEQRFRVLFEQLPIGILEYDYTAVASWFGQLRWAGVSDLARWLDEHPDELHAASRFLKIVGGNPAALRLFGATNLGGLVKLAETFTTDVYKARRHIFVTMWEGGVEADGEYRINTLDGRTLNIYYRWCAPLIDGKPHFGRTQLALVDLTRMRLAERAFAAERERLSVTLRAMSESVVTTDPAAVVQFMNEAAGSLTGWAPDAAIGRPIDEILVLRDEKTNRPVAPPVTAALAAGTAVDLPAPTVLKRKDGPARRVEGRSAPMHDAAGRALGVVVVLRDVTDRMRLESELVRASKLDSLGVLAGGIAHDFNNLLTVVMGNLTLALLEGQTPAATTRCVREAQQGAVRAKELTQQLLTFAKGGAPLREAVSLTDVVREAVEFALHGAAASCEFHFDESLRPAEVDKGQIGQVVHNLVINSVQAMNDGGVIHVTLVNDHLAAGAAGSLPAGDYLRLEISDTGHGIEPEHLARIFEPFFTTKAHGSGLGLATVYSVIQKHGGHVAVESEVGQGTTFRMWLPAARQHPVAPNRSNTPFERVGGRVLFMDDEEPIRMMTRMLLERLGFEPTLTCDGREAVERYTEAQAAGRPFDLVIMDLTVPGSMGGAEAMREILKVDPAARGIVSSGYSSNPVMANYREHGFRGMVPKPYRMSEFARTIREALNSE